MKTLLLLFLTFFFLLSKSYSQEFKKALNKDSLLQVILKDLPEERKAQLLKMYNEGNEESKELFVVMFSMSRSSKKEMIENIDSNFSNISKLKTKYAKLVPAGYVVSIEFNPASEIAMTKESIDIRVAHISDGSTDTKQEWDLEYDSKKLADMIKPLKWTNSTLGTIKKLLSDAKCVSIENGEVTTVGFARSGMGKYYFKLFEKDLAGDQISEYNDGCHYIFYKKNIVLEYGGGAVGPQCFPDAK